MHTRNLPQPGHNLFQVFEVGDVEHDLHASLAVLSTRPNISYITLSISDYTSNTFKHTKPVITINRKFHRISRRGGLVPRPLHIDAPFRFVHQVGNVRTAHCVHRHALATSDVAHDALSPNRIATARAVDQHVTLALDHDGVVIANHALPHARDSARLVRESLGFNVTRH